MSVRRALRRGIARWGLVCLALILLAVPIALAIAGPALAEAPAPPAAVTWPPLPTAPPGAPARLDDLYDPLPLIVTDLPDDTSRQAAADLRKATLGNPDLAAQAFLEASDGILEPLDQTDSDTVNQFMNDLAASAVNDQATQAAFQKDADAALPILKRDPRNADRLSNVSTALLALAAAIDAGLATNSKAKGGQYTYSDQAHGDWKFSYFVMLAANALWLDGQLDKSFPPNRAVLLNQAYFTSVQPGLPRQNLAASIPLARQWLDAHPTDRTARLLLGSLQARQPDTPGSLDQALATLTPLTQDRAAAPLGHAALGDAYLAASTRQQSAAYTARDLAARALDEYDRALALTTDPGVYAGRATALDALGGTASAVEAQQRAVALEPSSVDLKLGLAFLQEKTGDVTAMRATARDALAMMTRTKGRDPTLDQIRFLEMLPEATPGDRGYLGYSVGSDRPRDQFLIGALQGGVFVVSMDVIPVTDVAPDDPTNADLRFSHPEAEVARDAAVTASILLGQPEQAQADGAQPAQIFAAQLVANQPFPSQSPTKEQVSAGLFAAQTSLRSVGRFADAAAVCRRAADAPRYLGLDTVTSLQCAGESAYLAKDYHAAASALDQAYTIASASTDRTVNLNQLRLEAAAAAQANGDDARARDLYTLAAGDVRGDSAESSVPVSTIVGLEKLGELDLIAGDPAQAVAHDDLALAAIDAAHLTGPDADARTLGQVQAIAALAHNNRGLARLWLDQPSADAPPDCTGPKRAACVAAQADFGAALGVDPREPLFLMNAGWAARLLGDTTAARAFLTSSVAADPFSATKPSPAAYNDLGVLDARAGDSTGARRAFAAARAVDPTYALAAWNLGVLNMQRGILGIPIGQADLARAILEMPSLRAHPLTYITDERVYRATLGANGLVQPDPTTGQAFTIATIAIGAIVVVAAGWQALQAQATSKAVSTFTALGRSHLSKLAEPLRRRTGRLAPVVAFFERHEDLTPWLLTIPALVVTTALPVWQSGRATAFAVIAIGLLAMAAAVVVHELGHQVAATVLEGRIKPAHWGAGILVSLIVAPVQVTSGPFVGHRVESGSAMRTGLIYLAGPLANLLVALVTFALSIGYPAPMLRLIAQVQLAAAAYSLLPFEPLDGKALGGIHPLVLPVLGTMVAGAGTLVAQGRI